VMTKFRGTDNLVHCVEPGYSGSGNSPSLCCAGGELCPCVLDMSSYQEERLLRESAALSVDCLLCLCDKRDAL
jgi:hypothetical protein